MPTITASDARKSLFLLLGQINEEHSAVTITITSKGGNGVLVSEEDYETWQTTLVFSSPANARRHSESIERSGQGDFQSHELDRS